MTPNIDIQHTARLLFRRYGDASIVLAATLGFALFADGDLDGCLMWLAVVRSIEELAIERE